MSRFLKIVFALLPVFSLSVYGQNKGTSVLANGNWFKIAVTTDGIYRIDYSKLKQLGLANPSKPKLYGNNQGQLSYYNNAKMPDDLNEMAIYISGKDSVLNEGEYMLFYGKTTHRWIYDETKRTYSFLRHNYSDTAFYFLTSGEQPGKRIVYADSTIKTNGISSSSDAIYIHENENENLLKSGREWFQPVPLISGLTINPGFSDVITSEKMRYSIRVAARAAINTLFRMSEGSILIKNISVPAVNLYNYTGTYANITEYTDSVFPGSASPVYDLKYINNGTSSENAGWLDYITFQGRKTNRYKGTFLQISDSRSTGPGRITEFRIISDNTDAVIWDVSDINNVRQILYKKAGETISYKDSSQTLRSYVIFSVSNALTPVIRNSSVPNQDLHGSAPADMIIVAHPIFLNQARKLADLHEQNDGIVSLIVTPEQI